MLDVHVQGAAGKTEMLQSTCVIDAPSQVEARKSVVTKIITDPDQCRVSGVVRQPFAQFFTCRIRIIRQTVLGEIQLVGAIDQLNRTINVTLDSIV